MAEMSGRVTVIIPTFRAAAFVDAAVRSALGQTMQPDVIVVDDASDDGTVECALEAGAGSKRLTVLRQRVNAGPAAARNRAIDQASTEWIALLDADDRMAPDRLEKLTELAKAHDWDMVADDLVRVMAGQSPAEGRRHWSDEDFGPLELDFAGFVRGNIRTISGEGRELGYLKPVMRRAFLDRHALRYHGALRLGEDFDLYARALLAGARFGLVDPQGYYATDRPGSLSKGHGADDLRELWRADRRMMKSGIADRASREALKAHMRLSHQKWAWARLIESVRTRNPVRAGACFIAPPAVVGDLVRRVHRHFHEPSGNGAMKKAHG
jgi:succinoglycan biosynthesis protein ExoU